MKLKAIKGFCLGNGKDVQPGDIFDATDMDAAIHIGKGRAVKAEIKEPKAKPSATSAKG